ncbi:MAG: BamA/TamA family outer membrane protein [Calditrichia bacterium]
MMFFDKFLRANVLRLVVSTSLLFGISSLQAVQDSTATAKKSDYTSKSNFEKVIDLPGEIIFLPFRLIFGATSSGIAVVYDNHLLPRIASALTSDDGKRGLRPIYSSRSGFGLKFFWKDFITPGGRLTPKASIGLLRRQAYELSAKRITILNGNLVIGASAGYYNMPDESFFGVGINAPEEDRANYAREMAAFELNLGPNFTPRLKTDLTFGYEINNILPGRSSTRDQLGEVFDLTTLSGVETGVKLGRAAISLEYNGTNSLGNPSSGFLASFHTGLYSQMGDEEQYGFTRTGVDLSQHFNLFKERTLVLRLAAEDVAARDDKEIPFYYLSEIGSQETVRGFPRGRFHDEDMLLGSAEYRFPLRNRTTKESISALFFVDAGKVTPDLYDSFNADNLEVTYGLGFRVWKQSGLLTKFEVGFSSDGFRLILSID